MADRGGIDGGRFRTLDGVRGVAAWLVAVFHLQQLWHRDGIAGYLAVDLFFGLSGFVLALTYEERLERGMGVAAFAGRRLLRLVPLYLVGLMLGIASLAWRRWLGGPGEAAVGDLGCAVAFGAAMLPDPCSADLFPLNGPAWSLFLELAVNLLFAAALWRLPTRALAALVTAAGVALVLSIGAPEYANVGWAWHNLGAGAIRTVFSFGCGMLLFRWHAGARRASAAALLPVALVAAVIAIGPPSGSRAWAEPLTVTLLWPALLAIATRVEPQSPGVARLFARWGDLSYPLYAIHWPLLAAMVAVADRLNWSPLLTAGPFLLALYPAAVLAARADTAIRAGVAGAIRPWAGRQSWR
jgi:peptidoglycan/LPS O-acetylase OafA/YrhL